MAPLAIMINSAEVRCVGTLKVLNSLLNLLR